MLVGKWAGFPYLMKGGFGLASLDAEGVVVAAAAVVNAVGDVVNGDGTVLAGARDPAGGWLADRYPLRYVPETVLWPAGTNTTLVVVATNATLSRSELARLAHQAHNGMAIAVRPSHTRHDGDIAFALATQQTAAPLNLVNNMAVAAVAEAIRNAVRRHAATRDGAPGLKQGAMNSTRIFTDWTDAIGRQDGIACGFPGHSDLSVSFRVEFIY